MTKETFMVAFTENGKETGKLTVEQFRSGYKVPKMVSLPEAVEKFNKDNQNVKAEIVVSKGK